MMEVDSRVSTFNFSTGLVELVIRDNTQYEGRMNLVAAGFKVYLPIRSSFA